MKIGVKPKIQYNNFYFPESHEQKLNTNNLPEVKEYSPERLNLSQLEEEMRNKLI